MSLSYNFIELADNDGLYIECEPMMDGKTYKFYCPQSERLALFQDSLEFILEDDSYQATTTQEHLGDSYCFTVVLTQEQANLLDGHVCFTGEISYQAPSQDGDEESDEENESFDYDPTLTTADLIAQYCARTGATHFS